jgi:hypothetical protein
MADTRRAVVRQIITSNFRHSRNFAISGMRSVIAPIAPTSGKTYRVFSLPVIELFLIFSNRGQCTFKVTFIDY